MDVVTRLITDDRGADLVEYALVAGLIALGAITGINGVAATMKTIWSNMVSQIHVP
jgi:Flp pilus assembly pilin Flp